jgi:hypothetical protein
LFALISSRAVVAGIAAVVYFDCRGQISGLTAVYDVRQALNQILVNTEKTNSSLRNRSHVLNDAHKRTCAKLNRAHQPWFRSG